jgi:Flp pilus assembly protein CpaB
VTSLTAWLGGPGRRREWRRRVVRRSLAAACAVAAVLGVLSVARGSSEPVVPVVVAARPLAVGEVVTAASVRLVAWPIRLVPQGAAHDLAEVVGRPLASPVGPGESVTRSRFDARSLLAGRPSGEVAVHVAVADDGAVSMVASGDRIDLLSAGRVVARGVLVLRVERPVRTDFGSVISGQGSSGGFALDGPGLVVAADEETARAVAAAPVDASGRAALQLVLRGR